MSDKIYSITELNNSVKKLLETSFASISVVGEISNLSIPSSGHAYFSLKDKQSQVKCAFFKGALSKCSDRLENGLEVEVVAKVSLYPGRGDFQLIVQKLSNATAGALRKQYLALLDSLKSKGLFEQEHKLQIPKYPKRIGIVTSPTGAALADILSVLQRRAPFIPVVVYSTSVQGDKARSEIIKAFNKAELENNCDVLLIARGGGSIEDLWPFNEEDVARSIYNCKIPTISGVGHEIDFTISDFVADLRAPTPSGAAELATPNKAELEKNVLQLKSRVIYNRNTSINNLTNKIKLVISRIGDLEHIFRIYFNKLESINSFIRNDITTVLSRLSIKARHIQSKISTEALLLKISVLTSRCTGLAIDAKDIINIELNNKNLKLSTLSSKVSVLNPLSTLDRGYGIVKKENNIVSSSKNLKTKDRITVMLADGDVHCLVDSL